MNSGLFVIELIINLMLFGDFLSLCQINRNLNRFRPSPSNLPDTEKENAAPIFCSGGFLRDSIS